MASAGAPVHDNSGRERVVEGLCALFRRVAVFRLAGTKAHLSQVIGLDPERVGAELSLVDRTPLRSAIEAASPVIGSGRDTGGRVLARALGISPARTFAVIPLVENRRVVALAYGDRIEEPLSLTRTAELFHFCATQLGGRPKASPNGLRSSRARRAPLLRPQAVAQRHRAVPPPPPREAFEPDEFERDDGAARSELQADPPSGAAPGPSPDPLPEWAAQTREILEAFTREDAPVAAPLNAPQASQPEELTRAESWTLARATAEALPQWSEHEGERSDTVLPPSQPVWVDADGAQAELPRGLAPFRRRRLLALIASAAIALIIAVPATALVTLAPPTRAPTQTVVHIPDGASFRVIAARLREAGVIKNELAFKLVAQLTGVDRALKAGTYRLAQNAYGWEIASELARGQVNLRQVTVPEGLSVDQIASLVAEAGLASHSAFVEATRDPALLRELGIPARSAEGYLYPETYRLAIGLSARDIVTLMVQQFEGVKERLGVRHEGEALRRWVTLASLVQREVRAPMEMGLVAGVFRNRLARDMRLESCATVQYILGEPKAKLTLDDVRIPHDYNTYLHEGLPPGPIASPGADALAAAAQPAEHDYLFFVAREDGTGRHLFSRTYREHLQAKAKVERMNR